jgi:hypothetical protein
MGNLSQLRNSFLKEMFQARLVKLLDERLDIIEAGRVSTLTSNIAKQLSEPC